jgi:hypothetical protein
VSRGATSEYQITNIMLQTVYGDESLSRSSAFEWFKRFKDWRDDPRSGRLSTSRNADIIVNVREMVTRDRRLTLRMMSDELNINRRLTLRMMSDELNINKKAIRQNLHEDSRKRKICSKFNPHSITDERKQRRLTSCQDFIQTCQDNPSFLDCIVTGDGSWVFQYDLETKRQSTQWTSK